MARINLPYGIDNFAKVRRSILYLTGYLTQLLPEQLSDGIEPVKGKMVPRIPNEEVESVFCDTVKLWFEDRVITRDRSSLFRAWWTIFCYGAAFLGKPVG